MMNQTEFLNFIHKSEFFEVDIDNINTKSNFLIKYLKFMKKLRIIVYFNFFLMLA